MKKLASASSAKTTLQLEQYSKFIRNSMSNPDYEHQENCDKNCPIKFLRDFWLKFKNLSKSES